MSTLGGQDKVRAALSDRSHRRAAFGRLFFALGPARSSGAPENKSGSGFDHRKMDVNVG